MTSDHIPRGVGGNGVQTSEEHIKEKVNYLLAISKANEYKSEEIK